jgi:hypothetical protein
MSDTFANRGTLGDINKPGETGLDEAGTYGGSSKRGTAPCSIGAVLKKG